MTRPASGLRVPTEAHGRISGVLATVNPALSLIIALQLVLAAVWALIGTNAQARLAREKLLNDDDPLVAEAGRVWTPRPRWLARSDRRRRRAEVEARVREDPERAERYERLRQELVAWNALESSVAVAFAASLLAVWATIVNG